MKKTRDALSTFEDRSAERCECPDVLCRWCWVTGWCQGRPSYILRWLLLLACHPHSRAVIRRSEETPKSATARCSRTHDAIASCLGLDDRRDLVYHGPLGDYFPHPETGTTTKPPVNSTPLPPAVPPRRLENGPTVHRPTRDRFPKAEVWCYGESAGVCGLNHPMLVRLHKQSRFNTVPSSLLKYGYAPQAEPGFSVECKARVST